MLSIAVARVVSVFVAPPVPWIASVLSTTSCGVAAPLITMLEIAVEIASRLSVAVTKPEPFIRSRVDCAVVNAADVANGLTAEFN